MTQTVLLEYHTRALGVTPAPSYFLQQQVSHRGLLPSVPAWKETQMYCGTYESGRGTFSVSVLWKIAPPSKYYPIEVFSFMLEEEPWDKEAPIKEVLLRKEGKHWERAMESDLRFAVICSPEFWICDGCHRFVKAMHLGKKSLRARVFPTRDAMLPALQTRTSTVC